MLGLLGGLTAFLGQHAAVGGHAFQQPLLEALPTRLGAGGPVPELPLRAGHVGAGPQVAGPQLAGAVGGRAAPRVPALHGAPLPARAARLGALAPLLDHPLRRDDLPDGVEGFLLPAGRLVRAGLRRLLHEVGEFDLGLGQVAHGQHLDGQGLLERAEAADALQRGRGAAVAQHAALVGDVLLQRGQRVVAVEDVGAVGGFDGQEAAVVPGAAVVPLLHLDVGRPRRDGDHVVVAGSAREERETLRPLLYPGKGKKPPNTRLSFV